MVPAMESLQGKLLLASSQLLDPNFARAVILMVQHGDEGALGLVLNRDLETTIQEACAQALELPCIIEGPLHQGGPCEGPLMVLSDQSSANEIEVLDDLYFTRDRQHIESLLLKDGAATKFFVGYAGWSPGQLEAEIEAGAWLSIPADKSHVFAIESGQALWSQIMSRLTLGRWIDPGRIPEDPNLN